MHLPINVKSPNNISKWHMGFNSAFKGLNVSIEMYGIRSGRQDGQSASYYSRLISETPRQKFTPIFPLSASYTSLTGIEHFMIVS
jgi:hypothetical protein